MKFGHPAWLLAGPAVGLAIFLFLRWRAATDRRLLDRFARTEALRWLAPSWRPQAGPRRALLLACAVVLVGWALARPQWGEREETFKVSGTDVVFALDVSKSMAVEDVIPNRLKRAKKLIREITDGLGGDRVGLVLFAGSSYLACPLTTNSEYFLDTVSGAGPTSIANQGTDLAAGVETAFRALERAAEEGSGPSQISTKSIVVITDGEDHEGRAKAVAEKVKVAGARVFVVGVGTEKGGPIPVRDEAGKLVGYKKEGADTVLSRLRGDTLTELARASGGEYWTVSDSGSEVREILSKVGSLGQTQMAERKWVVHEERFQWPLFLAVILLFFEMLVSRTTTVVAVLAVVLPLGALSGFALAEETTAPMGRGNPLVPDSLETFLENRKGVQAFKDGDHAGAATHFGAAQELDPRSPEVEFNLGVAGAGSEDPKTSVDQFGQAAGDAIARGKPGIAGQALFNRGALLGQKGEWKEAAKSYLGALGAAKLAGDTELEKDARKNLELLVRQEEQKQQQQKNQNQDNQDQNQQPQQQQGENPGDKKDDDQQNQARKDEQQQDKRYENPGKMKKNQRFKSEKLTPEDAERVLSELAEREKQLQARLNRKGDAEGKQKQQPGARNGKDW